MIFTDSHVHFWNPALFNYPWLAKHPGLAEPHTPSVLAAEAGECAPSRLVFVQAECAPAQAMDEVRWIERLAAKETRIAGIVAHAPMDRSGETRTWLEQLKAVRLVRGVRHLIQGESDPDFCQRPSFIEGVRRCGSLGLAFDLCCVANQLPAVLQLVHQCPETSFVLDHGGKPAIRSGTLDPWRKHIHRLAGHPRVSCKLSALITQADHARWQLSDLRPYWDHLVASFGPARLLFGSDWPVVKLGGSYRQWLLTAKILAETLSRSDRSAIFHDNATRIYNLS